MHPRETDPDWADLDDELRRAEEALERDEREAARREAEDLADDATWDEQ